MHWLGEIATFCNRFEVRIASVVIAALVLVGWMLVRLTAPAPKAGREGGSGHRWLGATALVGVLLAWVLAGSTLAGAGISLYIVGNTELILRTREPDRAARLWELMLGIVFLPMFFVAVPSMRPMAEMGAPWAPVLVGLLWTASWLAAAVAAMPVERRAVARRALPVLAILGTGLSLMTLRVPYDPEQELPRMADKDSVFDLHELPARAALYTALESEHRAPAPRPARIDNLRPFDANLPAVAATLQVDEVAVVDREELRSSLPLAELLSLRSEPAALVVAASLHHDEIRGSARASWRAEIEYRWRRALVAPYRRLPQMRQILTAAVQSHDVDFQVGREHQVHAELQRLWGQDLGWRGFPDGVPGFRAQEGSELYDSESTSAGVWLARAFGWPDGTDPEALRRALAAADSRPWFLGGGWPPGHINLHDAASLTLLQSSGPRTVTVGDFLRDWLDALAILVPAVSLCFACLRVRRRFPDGLPWGDAVFMPRPTLPAAEPKATRTRTC